MKAEIKRRLDDLESYQRSEGCPTQIYIAGVEWIDGSLQATSASRLDSEGTIVQRKEHETEREFLTRAEHELFEGVQNVVLLPAKDPQQGEKS